MERDMKVSHIKYFFICLMYLLGIAVFGIFAITSLIDIYNGTYDYERIVYGRFSGKGFHLGGITFYGIATLFFIHGLIKTVLTIIKNRKLKD